jgi:hypothetical protein
VTRLAAAGINQKGTRGSPFFGLTQLTLGGFDDPIATDALGAHPGPLDGTVNSDSDRLQVGHPPALMPIVRMTDVVARGGAFTADGANAGHWGRSPLVLLGDQAAKLNNRMALAQDFRSQSVP